MKAHFAKISKGLALLAGFFAGSALLITASTYLYLSPELPSPETLRSVKLQTPLQIYSRDHRLMAEFGEKRRKPITYEQIPEDFIHAILAAEDDNFYNHSGVDIRGLIRAAAELALTGEIQSGGSTITMQLTRNFFLSTEQSFIRKFNEILLALRIEDDFSKEEILTLYANKIYLGNRAYGIEAAARVYYGLSIDQLQLHQLAMIAGLPKAPSAFNPLANPRRATERRNWILARMHKLGSISTEEMEHARATVDDSSYHSPQSEVDAPYVAEMARQKIINSWGLDAYTEGYIVTTTVDSSLQQAAVSAVRDGLHAYDWRHGYRGAEDHIGDPDAWETALTSAPRLDRLLPAIVTEVTPESLSLLLTGGNTDALRLADNDSLRLYINEDAHSAVTADFTEVFQKGDLIRVHRDAEGNLKLTQIPRAQSALVSLDPGNGAILALVGGYDFGLSHFNRADQAIRQPGSNFKPFIYTRALEKGMTPATLINDAPIVFHDPNLEKAWRPENSSGKFYGPTPLRTALYRSRNLVSIRILRQIGIDYAIAGMGRFGFTESELPKNLSLALGTLSTTPLKIAEGYTAFANGGFKVEPYLIQKVETLDGKVIYEANPATVCDDCSPGEEHPEPDADEASSLQELFARSDNPGKLPNPAKRIIDAPIAFIMDSMLKDVISRGTATKARVLGRSDIGGKTGTTNGPRDAWFSGYSPHMVTTVWLGFDENLLLGRNEFGGSAALPIWIEFMKVALAGKSEIHRSQPAGLVTVRINPATGNPVAPGDPSGVYEYFYRDKKIPAAAQKRDTPEDTGAPLPEELF